MTPYKIFTLLFVVMLIPLASASLLDGLISFYPLDGTTGAIVDVNLANDGTNINIQRGIPGILINGVNGTTPAADGYINISNDGSAAFSTTSVSISMWIKPDPNINSPSSVFFIDKRGTGGDANNPFFLFKDTGSVRKVSFHISNGVSESTITSPTATLTEHVWTHFIATYNETSGNQSLWVNGSLVLSKINGGFGALVNPNERNFVIGARATDGINSLNGSMDEIGIWNRALVESEVLEMYNSGNARDMSGIRLKNVTLNSPANGTAFAQPTVDFNATLDMLDGTMRNATLVVHRINGTLFSDSLNVFVTGSRNDSLFTLTGIPLDTFTWNVEMHYTNTTGKNVSLFALQNRTFSNDVSSGSQFFLGSAYETSIQFFQENITIPNGFNITSANFTWNNTDFGGNFAHIAGNNYSLSKSMVTPLTNGSVLFNWTIVLNSTIDRSFSANNQTVLGLFFGLTNATQSTTVLNISFRNETVAQEPVTALVSSFFSTYHVGNGSIVKTFSFTSATEELNYSFGTNANTTLSANYSINYDNIYSESRSLLQAPFISLTSIVTEKILFLLPSSEGIFVTFQVLNVGQQTLSDVLMVVKQGINEIFKGFTDSAGLVTIFLNPATSYSFEFSKEGFDNFTTILMPTQSTFTINLGGGPTDQLQDFSRGITYSIEPTDILLDTDRLYNFSLTLSSEFWTLDSFGFNLVNSTGQSFGSVSSTVGTGGTISLQNIDTGNSSQISMLLFWEINGTFSNTTRVWQVVKGGDSSFSILNFFTDLSTYISSGLFGLKDFGLRVIVFLAIFLFAGVLSFKFGLTSPTSIAGLMTAGIGFFDVALNLVPNPTPIANFPTIVMVILTIALAFREGSR